MWCSWNHGSKSRPSRRRVGDESAESYPSRPAPRRVRVTSHRLNSEETNSTENWSWLGRLGIIMMILCLLVIQCGNDYISGYFWIILCNLLYYACILISFYRRRLYLCFHFMFWVLGDMFWICNTWILMSTFFYDCHDFFIIFLTMYVASCAYRPSPIWVAETDPSWCPPSRRLRPRLWTIFWMA